MKEIHGNEQGTADWDELLHPWDCARQNLLTLTMW